MQQISWHKYDFIGMLLLALVFFACSIAILVGAAQGRHYSLVLCSICSANVALVLYAAARYAKVAPITINDWAGHRRVIIVRGKFRCMQASGAMRKQYPAGSHAVQAGRRCDKMLRSGGDFDL